MIRLTPFTSGYIGIDVLSGRLNWQHNPGYKGRSIGSFVLQGDVLFSTFGSGGGGKESALLKLGDGQPQDLGRISKRLPYVATPLLLGGSLYMLNDSGLITCVSFPSGDLIYDERLQPRPLHTDTSTDTPLPDRLRSGYFSSPVAGDEKIFCSSLSGHVTVLKAGDRFKVLATNQLDGPIQATPAIAHDRLFIRTSKSLWCIGEKNP